MKLLKRMGNQWEYELNVNEAMVLKTMLDHFPVTKLFPAKMAKGHHDAESLDRENLLNAALAKQRDDLKKAAEQMAKDCLAETSGVWLLKLRSEHKELLLQILNDTRIGIWKELGEPADLNQVPALPAHKPLWAMMNLAGYFQENLLTELS